MADWPSLPGVKDVYELFEEKLPFGRVLAKAGLLLLWMVFFTWAAGFIFAALVVPGLKFFANVDIRGPIFLTRPILDPAPVLVSAILCFWMWAVVIRRLRVELGRVVNLLKAEETGLLYRVKQLKEEIAELEERKSLFEQS